MASEFCTARSSVLQLWGPRFPPSLTLEAVSFAGPIKDGNCYFVVYDNHRVVQPRVHRELQCHEQFRVHRGWCRIRIHLAVLIETLQILYSTTSVDKRVMSWFGEGYVAGETRKHKLQFRLDPNKDASDEIPRTKLYESSAVPHTGYWSARVDGLSQRVD